MMNERQRNTGDMPEQRMEVREQGSYPVTEAGLYSSQNEHDACGVGLVADLNNEATHAIVEKGLTVLKRLMHRGAAGSDPETGDGAGIMVSLPDEFFRRILPGKLPPKGQYGVAMVFGGTGQERAIRKIIESEGASIILWRDVPVNLSSIGKSARETCPAIRQVFINGEKFEDRAEFERKLFVIRRGIEKSIDGCYVCTCSSRSIVYKGLLLATQLENFYDDLREVDFKSPLAIVHQRFSTNTFPTWNLAHPFRYLAHNGEINTLRGNLNHLKSRESHFKSTLLGKDLKKVLPLVSGGQSDSASLDNMLELLLASGRGLRHAMLMLMPQAWGINYAMGRDVRGFFEYHSAVMEPWDGPAAVAFSDGINVGAMLDRNGLRPARYTLTRGNLFVLASEAGVLDIPAEDVVLKGRLRPGEMIFCDLENNRLINDGEIKKRVARRQPYRRWVEENRISVNGLFSEITPSAFSHDLAVSQKLFGYTREDVDLIIKPMAMSGSEAIGSMGNDAPLAVLSSRPQLLFNYFKQLFAQVTNPPIDPIREELGMSLTTYIGNKGNILEEGPEHARVIQLKRPVLTDDELSRLRRISRPGFQARTILMGFDLDGGGRTLEAALSRLSDQAVEEVRNGNNMIILSDKNLPENMTPIPSLLATVAVNQALVSENLRPEAAIILETGEVREVMHYALLLGYGATAINPYLALETVSSLVEGKEVGCSLVTATHHYIKAVDKGILKIMSKMGISTLRSYRSGQLFEAVGLDSSVIDVYFPGTASRVGGISLQEIAEEANTRRYSAMESSEEADLPMGGEYHYRRDGENHLWTTASLSLFRQAVRQNNAEKYEEYARLINDQSERLCTLRGLFEFTPVESIPLEEVESVESILMRFVSGAMSLGSLSPEAHEMIAIAMNSIGGRSNSGEGGEDSDRYTPGAGGQIRSSAIKQIASGRFGVTIDYLRHAKELQIKMAQGAKPGEGGQLPGSKVNEFIARVRHSMPNVTLISPPPHHDIYSIEDLAQLIFDLRNANPEARVSVKLVSEVGVGTVAAGVVKADADMVLISGHDGGTGASPLTSIKHAGLPWELGLAEAQQTLVLNNLRSQVRLQVDGQIKTGRDVVIGALLGAEEFGFGTTILVALGCVMMRKCHDNSCPVGVATQDPKLRAKFSGKAEYVVNFLRFVAEETRHYLAQLGLRSLDDAVGRTDLLTMNRAIDFYKSRNLDFSRIFQKVKGGSVRFDSEYRKPLPETYDSKHLLPVLMNSLDKEKEVEMDLSINNTDRTVGTELSGVIVSKRGADGLAGNSIILRFHGCAGQSFGAFLAPGVTLELRGEANDFVGKGLSGGNIIIRPAEGSQFEASENVIAGNVIGYGGTSGKIFINGQAGERFAIRNSGMIAVVEGIGDHGCEYMTGGRVVVLGNVGVNFAAGMTGGLAYVYDTDNDFDLRCNVGTVDLENIAPGSADEAELLSLIHEHYLATGSARARTILSEWKDERARFVKVLPVEYRQVLERMSSQASGEKGGNNVRI